MEIPEINMISNFEAGVNCLQNPSLVSRSFSLPGIENGLGVYSFWKWGALIFAILATFSGLIRRIKLIFIRFHTILPSANQIQQIGISEDDDISLASSSDDEREEEEEEESIPTTSSGVRQSLDEDSFVKGRLRNRRRRVCGSDGFDWSDFTSGKNVVKLWDSLSSSFNFGLDFDDFDSNDVVSRWDGDRRRDSNGFPGRDSNIPAVLLTAKGNEKGDGVVLRGYDTRVRRRVPDLYAEWRSSPVTKGASLAASTTVIGGKIYVRDDVNGVLTVGDVRNVRMPLENTGDSDGETWWDADAVIMDDEYVVVDKST